MRNEGEREGRQTASMCCSKLQFAKNILPFVWAAFPFSPSHSLAVSLSPDLWAEAAAILMCGNENSLLIYRCWYAILRVFRTLLTVAIAICSRLLFSYSIPLCNWAEASQESSRALAFQKCPRIEQQQRKRDRKSVEEGDKREHIICYDDMLKCIYDRSKAGWHWMTAHMLGQ